MSDLPIPFSGPMVQAILREIAAPGTGKTQTRRLIEPVPYDPTLRPWMAGYKPAPLGLWQANSGGPYFLPRYAVGDRLYVREHWRCPAKHDAIAPRDLTPRGTTIFYECGGSASTEIPAGITCGGVNYGPETGERWIVADTPSAGQLPAYAGRFRQGMHMPRWASRITLIVTEVKVERLQDCSEADAKAEGVIWSEPTDEDRQWARDYADEHGGDADIRGVWLAPGTRQGYGATKEERDRMQWGPTAAFAYRCVWESLHGPGSWDRNPWVAAYTFRPIPWNIDTIKEGCPANASL